MIHQWTPQIGDPSVLGWLTVLCYFIASMFCFGAAGRDPGAARLWRALGLLLVILGLNKQLDFQTLLTQIGRDFARVGDWYDQRREVQRLFVDTIMAVAALSAIGAVWIFRNQSRAFRVAAAGFALLAAFICIRAASFHHVDAFLKSTLFGARFNGILELGGIGVVAFAAASAGRQSPVANDRQTGT